MPKELSHAYPRLEREWGASKGEVLRLSLAYRKGIPDFVLLHPRIGTAWIEVKCRALPDDLIGLEGPQAEFLDRMWNYTSAGVLTYCIDSAQWGFTEAGNLLPRYKTLRFSSSDRYASPLTPQLIRPH